MQISTDFEWVNDDEYYRTYLEVGGVKTRFVLPIGDETMDKVPGIADFLLGKCAGVRIGMADDTIGGTIVNVEEGRFKMQLSGAYEPIVEIDVPYDVDTHGKFLAAIARYHVNMARSEEYTRESLGKLEEALARIEAAGM